MFIFEEVKKKNGEAYKHETLTAFQPSIHWHLKRVQWQICWMKTSLNFLDKSWNTEESSCWSNIGRMMSRSYLLRVAQNNGQQGRLTNHSGCKTCISRLLDLDIPVHVAQLSALLPKHEKSRFMLIILWS